MNVQDVIEALENSAPNRDKTMVDPRANPSNRDIAAHKNSIRRFLEDLDGELTVVEILEALE